MSDREHAHELIDRLPEMQISAWLIAGNDCRSRSRRLRNAPVDDEPESDEEKQSVAEARDWLKRNGARASRMKSMRR